MASRTDAAIDALRAVVAEMPLGSPPLVPAIAEQWATIGRQHVLSWVDDFGRLATRTQSALAGAASSGRVEDARDEFELALWSLDAAREHLLVIACLVLNVQLLVMNPGDQSVRFRPSPALLESRLIALSPTFPAAARLNARARAAAQHPAITLRNELSHSLSQVPTVNGLLWIDALEVDHGEVVSATSKVLYPSDRSLASGDISSSAVWESSLAYANAGLIALVEEAEALAELTAAAGHLEPPARVFWHADLDRASLEPLEEPG